MKYLLLFSEGTGAVVGHSISPDDVLPDAPDGYAYAEAEPADWVLAVEVDPDDFSLTLAESPQRTDPYATPKPATEILQENGRYRANRRAAYDPIPDQLDRLTATLERLSDQGVDIGKDGREQVTRWRSVKRRFPKTDLPTL